MPECTDVVAIPAELTAGCAPVGAGAFGHRMSPSEQVRVAWLELRAHAVRNQTCHWLLRRTPRLAFPDSVQHSAPSTGRPYLGRTDAEVLNYWAGPPPVDRLAIKAAARG